MPNKPKELYPKKNKIKSAYRDLIYGAIPKTVDVPFQKGELTPYKKRLINKQIKEIADNCLKFKIGTCGDIDIRMDDVVYREKYNHVTVVYKTKKNKGQ